MSRRSNWFDRLRKSRADWTPELQQAFYETSEEILWRTGRVRAPASV